MIDVIVPVYNVAPYLKQCINSIIKQTFKDYQLILVDDGSTDQSGIICDEYDLKYSFIKTIHQRNQGLSGARNTGIDNSYNEYIMFIDSDDWIEPDMLESLYSIAVNKKADIVCGGFYFEKTNSSISRNNDKTLTLYNRKDALMEILLRRIGVAAWGKLYRRELFKNVRYPLGKIHEDIPVIKELLLQAQIVVYQKVAYYHYRQQEGSLSRSKYTKKNYALYEHIQDLSSILTVYPELKEEYEGYYYFHLKSLLSLFVTKEVKEIYITDYKEFAHHIQKNISKIIMNKTLSLKDKVSILLVQTQIYKILKKIKQKVHGI